MLIRQVCPICGKTQCGLCGNCVSKLVAAPPPHIGGEFALGCQALFVYTPEAARLVLTLKRQRSTRLVGWLAEQLAEMLPPGAGRLASADCITWAPAAVANRRRRGFDQAEMLARRISRRSGIKCARLLLRLKDTPQLDRDKQGRLAGPALVPSLQLRKAAPTRVIVVDDVITTGATMLKSAAVLASCGVKQVGAIAVASRINSRGGDSR